MATSPSFFRILKGAEKKNDLKQSVMLDSQQSGLVIQEGTIYVTTDDGNMYIDVSPTKRIKIGALADKALQAEKDYNGNIIARYFNEASLTKTAVDNQIILQRGTSINPVTLSLTGATATAAGLITTGAQTLAGNKTFTGKINIQGEAADQPLQVSGIVGSNGTTTVSDLYLQYKANKLIYLGNDGKYTISADGGQYSGNAATATKAANDNNNHPITDYIKDVTYSVAATGDKVSFNFQRGSSNVFTHNITGATTAAAGLVTTGAQTFKGIKTFSSGTKMGASTWVNWLDSGKFTANNANETYPYDCGGLKWSEQSDAISLYAQATKRDNLDLVLNFGDDNSNSFRITDKEKTTTITMTATGDITASNFYGLASNAKADENGNQLTKTYIASLKYEAQTNTTDATNLPSIKGMAMDGTTVISTIPLPSASTGNNGLVSTTTQTFGGNKTFKNNLAVTGNTALSGTLGVTGKTTLSDALEVTGATTLKSILGVTGNTTLGGTLGVTGATTLTGNLTANGSVTMAQSLTISGIINSLVEKSAPFVVKSNIKVTNLNADKVDGYDVTNNDFSTAKDTDMSIPSVGAVIKTFLPLLQSIQGLRYRGSVDLTQTTDDTRFGKDVLGTVKVGDVFMISKGGAYAGIYLEPADMLVCVAKSGSVITWNYIQSNINGAVTIKGATEGNKDGANSLVSVDSIPIFSAATGRQITGSKIFIDGAGHLLPASGNIKQCLGSEERKWITVYANTFNGTNFTGTTFEGTNFTGTTFTGTTFTGNAASASKWKTARTITVKGADTGSVTLDGSQDVVLTLSVAHTHNYAGSSSAGGAANSANKLNTNAGSKTQPVYFSNGVPVACTSLNGNATSADKLSTARTIAVGTAVTSTATSFDGSKNIIIPIDSIKESYLEWGGKNFSASFGCIDAAMVPELGANRLAFISAASIEVQYSRDNGSTWASYDTYDADKINIFNGIGTSYYIGASKEKSIDKSTYQLRIIITTDIANVYTVLNKFVIFCSTEGSSNCWCTIDGQTKANVDAGKSTWDIFSNKTPIDGWSGYNVINTSRITTYGNTASYQYQKLRFTFGATNPSSNTSSGLNIQKIFGFGGVGWATPSNMAKTGHLYSWNSAQNAIFPAAITAKSFNGNASSATKLATARTLTIGNTGKTFDGTSNVSWSLSEIGVAAASHTHPYLPLLGGTMTGAITGITTSTSWINMSHEGAFKMTTAASNGGAAAALSIKTNTGSWGIGGLSGNDNLYFTYGSDTHYSAGDNSANSSVYIESTGGIHGAVWNDYAEYRKSNCKIPGKCIIEVGDDTLKLSIKRLQPGAEIISDTFGFAIGETEECKTPIAVSGRVLAYPYEPLEKFRENIGKPVCSGPNGTVSIMTDEEYQKFGYCAIGTISAVPDYEVWGSGNVKVNGRVWIKV